MALRFVVYNIWDINTKITTVKEFVDMADFNVVLDTGDYQSGIVNTVVEISKGSMMKIEWDRKRAVFMLDRVEPAIFAKPCNYGFIPQTLDEDGDELDTLIITNEALPTGIWLEAKIIGILNFDDDGEADHKVVVVPADDRNTGDSINTLDDLGERWKQQIEHHFTHYKDLKKPGSTKVLGWGDIDAAKAIIAESIERYKNQG
jgi:inorganic pyrophosphatase